MSWAKDLWPLGILLVVFFGATFLLSPGQFTLDEFIYYAGAEAVQRSGSFVVQNGGTSLSSEQLELLILVSGPNGLVPQYPIGTALLGAPLLGLFGMHGFILVNSMGAAVTVFVLYKMTERHFGGRSEALTACALLLCGTFFLEYAFAIWPHAVSVMCVTIAMALLFDSITSDQRAVSNSLGIGVAIGVGMLFRTDTVLAVPAVGLAMLFFPSNPFHRLFWMGLGFSPFVAAASIGNYIKFGTLNPVSYGQGAGGGTSIAGHLPVILGLLLVGVAIVGLYFIWQRIENKRNFAIAGVIAVLLGAIVGYDFTGRYLHGFWGLVVDATNLYDPRPGVVYLPDGTVAFWGLWKKALGQSMPWLGLLLASFWGLRDVDWRIRISILLLAAVWSFPFFPKDWHGGMGSNMRYFLALIPFACAIVAKLLLDLCRAVREPQRYLVLGALLTVVPAFLWVIDDRSQIAHINQSLPTWIFLIIGVLALLGSAPRTQSIGMKSISLISLGGGLGLSLTLAMYDLGNAQWMRNQSVELSRAYGALPDQALAYIPARFTIGWSLRKGHYLASPNTLVSRATEDAPAFDFQLIEGALNQDMRVFISPDYVTEGLRTYPGTRLIESEVGPQGKSLLELVPAEKTTNG